MPNVNVATPAYNAVVISGDGANLLADDAYRYDMERSFMSHTIGGKARGIVVEVL